MALKYTNFYSNIFCGSIRFMFMTNFIVFLSCDLGSTGACFGYVRPPKLGILGVAKGRAKICPNAQSKLLHLGKAP